MVEAAAADADAVRQPIDLDPFDAFFDQRLSGDCDPLLGGYFGNQIRHLRECASLRLREKHTTYNSVWLHEPSKRWLRLRFAARAGILTTSEFRQIRPCVELLAWV